MATVVAGMTVSLDGFVAEATGSARLLYTDLPELRRSAYMDATIEETGAVLMGRRTFEMGDPDWYVGNYEFQVPIFVLTHHPPETPPKQDERLTFTFVTDGVVSAVEQAKAAAGDKAVQVVGGASVVQQLLRARARRRASCRRHAGAAGRRAATPRERRSRGRAAREERRRGPRPENEPQLPRRPLRWRLVRRLQASASVKQEEDSWEGSS
jgi:dihydrofolate reductase